jgi:hypothetical protein
MAFCLKEIPDHPFQSTFDIVRRATMYDKAAQFGAYGYK